MKKFIAGFLVGCGVTVALFLVWNHEQVYKIHRSYIEWRDADFGWETPQINYPYQVDHISKLFPELQLKLDIVVADKILVPPPKYSPEMPEEFKTREPGEFKIKWIADKGAKRTRVFVYDHKGVEVKTNSTRRDFLYIMNIPYSDPTQEVLQYSVRMASKSVDGVWGQMSEARVLWIYRDHFKELIIPKAKTPATRRLASDPKSTAPIMAPQDDEMEDSVDEPPPKRKNHVAPKILNIVVED